MQCRTQANSIPTGTLLSVCWQLHAVGTHWVLEVEEQVVLLLSGGALMLLPDLDEVLQG